MRGNFFTYRRALGLALLVCVGCGTKVAETLQETADQAQKAAKQVSDSVTKTADTAQTKVKEQLQMVGSGELKLDPAAPVKTPSCYALFTPATGGRPSFLALKSYRAAGKETFPSFYVQASATQTSLSELVGQTLPATMFVKPGETAATWYTPAAQTVELKIVAVEGQQVTAEVVSGALVSTEGGQTKEASGKFVGVLQ